MATNDLPERLRLLAGPLPPAGRLDPGAAHPFETVVPAVSGFVANEGVQLWYAVWGERGP